MEPQNQPIANNQPIMPPITPTSMPPAVPPAPIVIPSMKGSGQNGEKLHLTIEVLKANTYKAESFLLLSTKGTKQNSWLGLVGN